MTLFAEIVLIGSIPLILVIFGFLPPRRAVIASMVAAWLFLPNTGFALPGLPDFTKTSASTVGSLLGVLLFDHARVFRFRPKWFDLPILAWCVGNVFTAVSNDLTVYDGVSQALRETFQWGLPYFFGRIYLDDPEGCRDLAMGIVIGGLVYAPFCLWEVRMSPQLQRIAYGANPMVEARYGLGYRPIVFMQTGLEVGMWMAAATLCAYWLWVTGALRRLRGVPFGWLLAGLAVTTVLVKSVGAVLLLAVGVGLLELIRRTKAGWLLWVLVLLPPAYEFARTTGLSTGQNLVDWTYAVDAERGRSIEVRIVNENRLLEKALQRPILGWGGYGRNRVYNESGRDITITDGYWILLFGSQGLVGLVSMTLVFILPPALLCRRFPVRLWTGPLLAPAVVLAVLLGLYMIDNLSNAMVNPIYALAVGGVMSFRLGDLAFPRQVAADRLGQADALKEAGRAGAAETAYLQALDIYTAAAAEGGTGPEVVDQVAYVHEALADLLLLSATPDRSAEAEQYLRHALALREALAAAVAHVPAYRERLAHDLEHLGRFLYARGRAPEAEQASARALDVRGGLAAELPADLNYHRQWADAHNDLAWFLATHRDLKPDAAWDAVRLARRAVELLPTQGAYWNTLGAASYYAGDYPGAVAALTRSGELSGGSTGFDDFFLAMAYARLGEPGPARASFERADLWARAHEPGHPELARLRDEASALLHA